MMMGILSRADLTLDRWKKSATTMRRRRRRFGQTTTSRIPNVADLEDDDDDEVMVLRRRAKRRSEIANKQTSQNTPNPVGQKREEIGRRTRGRFTGRVSAWPRLKSRTIRG